MLFLHRPDPSFVRGVECKHRNMQRHSSLDHRSVRVHAMIRYSTFLRRWQTKWSNALAFRHRSAFTVCDVCHQLKQQLRDNKCTLEERLGAVTMYREHLHDQFVDRSSLWCLRTISSDHHSNTLVIVTDGIDQSKFALPRDSGLRCLSSLSKYHRPRAKVHGCWALGWVLRVGVMDETQAHDASCVLELLARTLEDVAKICEQEKRPFPATVLLYSDNTVRECKNNTVMKYLGALVGRFRVKFAGSCFLRKSHSHDLIDQLWGIIARRLASSDKLQSTNDIVCEIAKELAKPGIKSWIGQYTEVVVELVENYHTWRDHIASIPIKLEGGLRDDDTANHLFLYLLRRGSCLNVSRKNMFLQQWEGDVKSAPLRPSTI